MDFKTFDFELVEAKAVDDGWQFTGYLSTFSNVDEGFDVVIPGAFDRTLRERDFRPLLWSHDSRLPAIGVEKSLVVDEKGLLGTWDLLDTSLGKDVYTGLKAGAIRKMSMGYMPVEVEFDDSGVRKLLDVDLLESSVVNLAMNEQADVTRVKSAELPLNDHAARVLGDVESFLSRVKDLAALRADDGRKLGAKHFERLETLRVGVDELLLLKSDGELVSDPPPPTDEEALVPPPLIDDSIRLRLSIARKRLERLGILERSA